MSFFYRVCGLSIRSNSMIPGLLPTAASAPVDLELRFIGMADDSPWPADDFRLAPFYVSTGRDAEERPLLCAWRAPRQGFLHLRYADGTAFTLSRAADRMWISWCSPFTVGDAVTYLLGPVLGFVLRLRGTVCLHASAFLIAGGAVAVAGGAGWGKSTTVAALARRGFTIVSDDLLPLESSARGHLAVPAYPRLRLWTDSVETLYGSADELPRLTPNWDKRALDLIPRGYAFASEPEPVKAVYLLTGGPAVRAADVVRLSGQEALIGLIRNSYVSYLLDAHQRAGELESFAQLVREVPILQLELPDPLPHPDMVCDLLFADLASIGVAGAESVTTVLAGAVGR